MPQPAIPAEVRQRYKDTIEQCLREGFQPFRTIRSKKSGHGSAVTEAARRLVEQGFEVDLKKQTNKLERFIRTQENWKAKGREHWLPDWNLYAPPGVEVAKVKKGAVHRWILTAAQDDTDVHQRFWTNLQVFARVMDAEISVAGFTYQQVRHTDVMTLKSTYREELRDYLRFESMDCGPVLWCAEMNTLPTAARPLSGLEGYGRGRDAVFPHAKVQLVTVAQGRGEHVPAMLTTGAVTVDNYIPKKAGLKARFHHILGAVLVEVNDAGEAFFWHIQAAPDGSFQHLDIKVSDGKLSRGHRVQALVHGDVHNPYIAPEMVEGVWGRTQDSMLESLRPHFQFIHDLLDFPGPGNRHHEGDPLHHARMEVEDQLSVPKHVESASTLLRDKITREWCQTVVNSSNHDRRLLRWVKSNLPAEASIENAIFWHRARIAALEATRDQDEDFDLVLWALRDRDTLGLPGISFVPQGGSFVICQDTGGIECGWHGDEGANGSRGSPVGFAKIARKIIRGDAHSPSIYDGAMTVGVLGLLDQKYNTGPSSWRHANAIVYDNGKRTLSFLTEDGRWKA